MIKVKNIVSGADGLSGVNNVPLHKTLHTLGRSAVAWIPYSINLSGCRILRIFLAIS